MKKYIKGEAPGRILGGILILWAILIANPSGCSHLPKIGFISTLNELKADADQLKTDIQTLKPTASEKIALDQYRARLNILHMQLKADPSPQTLAFAIDKIPDIWVPARLEFKRFFEGRCQMDSCTKNVRKTWNSSIKFADKAEAFYLKNLHKKSKRRMKADEVIEYIGILTTVVKIVTPFLDQEENYFDENVA